MGYAYDHDCPFEAFITNLGKYNEGALVGEWVKFPTTAEELQKVFERIGIGSKDDFGHPYEEWFITDYRIMNEDVYKRQTLNVGRVMTPTLAMAVMREAAISAFKPELFYTCLLYTSRCV